MTEPKAVVLLMVVLAACEGAGTPPAVTRRDSAGIVIVESSAPQWTVESAWRVDPTPVIDFARPADGPMYEFFRVIDATRLRDGSFAVAEAGSAQIAFFSADGRFFQAVGREGEGPGEFQRLTSIHQITGDSLLAFDYWQGRITVLDPGGDFVRTLRPFDPDTRLWRIHPLRNGDLVGVLFGDLSDEASGPHRRPWDIVKLDLAGQRIDTIARVPGSESFLFADGDARMLFPRTGHVAVSGDRIHLGSADSMEVAEYDTDGRLVRLVRVPGFDLRLTSDQVAAERAAHLPANSPQYVKDLYERMPTPETRPAYSDLLVDAAGAVWAQRFRGRTEIEQPISFEVFGPDGAWLGSIRMPRRFTPLEIGLDYVLGVARDELDVGAVQLLRLHRG